MKTLSALLFLATLAPSVRADESEVDPREAYLACRDAEEAVQTECYQKGLVRLLEIAGVTDETRRDAFLAQNPRADAERAAANLYGTLFAGFEPRVEKAATRRWTLCRRPGEPQDPSERHNKEWTKSQTPYTPGERYLARNALQCINAGAYADLDAVRDEMSGRKFKIDAKDAVNLVRDLFIPKYLERLALEYERELMEEEAELKRRRPVVEQAIVDALFANPSWYEGVNPAQYTEKCEPRAKLGFTEYQRKVKPQSRIPTRLHPPGEIRDEWAKGICLQAKDLLDGWKASVVALEEAALRVAEKETNACRVKMGIAGRSSRSGCPSGPGFLLCQSRLQHCLRDAWERVDPEAIARWSELEFAKKNPSLKSAAARYLQKHRERLQRAFWQQEGKE